MENTKQEEPKQNPEQNGTILLDAIRSTREVVQSGLCSVRKTVQSLRSSADDVTKEIKMPATVSCQKIDEIRAWPYTHKLGLLAGSSIGAGLLTILARGRFLAAVRNTLLVGGVTGMVIMPEVCNPFTLHRGTEPTVQELPVRPSDSASQ
eukprot:GILK01009636.1.p1 GENE.GILK01009636.1~~GILK01009636.1.p1  ORF type:complete len:162 (-),score=17.44 GILK01009636.1:56-505(-)